MRSRLLPPLEAKVADLMASLDRQGHEREVPTSPVASETCSRPLATPKEEEDDWGVAVGAASGKARSQEKQKKKKGK